jgi:hypothetical protein
MASCPPARRAVARLRRHCCAYGGTYGCCGSARRIACYGLQCDLWIAAVCVATLGALDARMYALGCFAALPLPLTYAVVGARAFAYAVIASACLTTQPLRPCGSGSMSLTWPMQALQAFVAVAILLVCASATTPPMPPPCAPGACQQLHYGALLFSMWALLLGRTCARRRRRAAAAGRHDPSRETAVMIDDLADSAAGTPRYRLPDA